MTIRARVQELEKQLEELKQEISKQDKKEHKSLSDYRYYEEPKYFEEYKSITSSNGLYVDKFSDHELHLGKLEMGNMYSIDTPNELLEREIKKRQLWFALEKHLKEKDCLATNEDWKDLVDCKYSIYWDYEEENFDCVFTIDRKHNTIYSTDEDVLRDYMNTLSEEDIKIMFDVEE